LPDLGNAIFDASPLEQLLRGAIPFERIDGHLRAGRISAVTVSTTQIATGRTVVFVQRRRAHPAPWQPSSTVVPRSVRLRAVHTLASAAVPLLFPAVRIDGRYYCDGGLRQNIPLSPARRLGAQALIVINPKHRGKPGLDPGMERDREEAFPSPLFLLGKTLNALLLDRIDNEIDRLEKINTILDAGTRCYGDGFLPAINADLGIPPERALRHMKTVHIRSSENIGELAADHVRSPDFHVPGLLGRAMKRLAHGEAVREADLLSYLLFDGEFSAKLIELGRTDAAKHHQELCEVLESLRERP
jgi:NTE family protein